LKPIDNTKPPFPGTCAARAAAEEGASVIVVEKSAAPAVCRSGQWAIIGGETNKRWERGVGQANYIDPEEIINYTMGEMTTVGASPFLRINLKGQRFMDEDVPALQVQNATELHRAGSFGRSSTPNGRSRSRPFNCASLRSTTSWMPRPLRTC
jgi:hypothetical protein